MSTSGHPGATGGRVRPGGRRWVPPVALLAFLAVLVGGGYVTQNALANEVEPPVRVGPGVVVHPLSGWRQASTRNDAVLLTRGSGNLAVLEVDGQADPAELAAWYVATRLRPAASGLVLSRPLPAVRLPSGLVGARFLYQGDFHAGERSMPLRGEVTTVTGPAGRGAVFDAWALPETFRYVLGDVHRMIDTAEVR
ncbi:MAG TPA: hypothetical protein VEP73_12475 [Actinomycetota bacterium]|nr:hypothetical protein [Actinomycetota bacterium]